MTIRIAIASLMSAGLFASSAAFAQDDDPLGGSDPAAGSEAQVDTEAPKPSIELPGEDEGRRIIKVLPRKTFLKIGRWEGAPHIGFVTNDPFINRYFLGASVAYHATEVFAVEAIGSWSPDFGKGDWKSITHQLVEENRVSPDISKIQYYAAINFQYSPIYGKVAVGKKIINFDIYGVFGNGIVGTAEDLEAVTGDASPDDPEVTQTAVQIHPTTNIGGGFRVIFGQNLAVRLEGRTLSYIEVVSSSKLEMKNNFILMSSVSFFVPNLE